MKESFIYPEDLPSESILKHPVVQEMAELALGNVQLPLVLKHRVCMDEGIWNGKYYNHKNIEKAVKNTVWDKHTTSLFLDHEDNRVSEWVGYVNNLKMDGTKLYADLEIYDPVLAIKMNAAKPKFGISPRLRGLCDSENNEMVDFVYDNFSIVINPAVKTAFINNFEEVQNMPEPFIQDELEDNNELEMQSESEEMAKKKPEKYPPEATAMAKKKKEYPYPQEMKKKVVPEAKCEEESEEDILSSYTDFIQKYMKSHAGSSIKDAAKAWKSQSSAKKLEDDMAEASKLDALIEHYQSELEELMKKKDQYKKPEEMMQKMESLSARLDSIDTKLATLGDNVPDKRSVNVESTPSNKGLTIEELKKDADGYMAKFLKDIGGVQ